MHRVNIAAALSLGFAILVASCFAGTLLALGCSENLYPETTRKEVCDAIGSYGALEWWFAVTWPVGLFAMALLIPWVRGHLFVAVTITATVAAAFWVPLLMIVTSNLLAD